MNLAEWEQQNIEILTSKEMGEWLIKRFTNKNLNALAEVKRRINHRIEEVNIESQGIHGEVSFGIVTGKIRGLKKAIEIIDDYAGV